MKYVSEWVMWLFVGALAVLVVKNPKGFASATTAVGGQVNKAATTLTGTGYKGGY